MVVVAGKGCWIGSEIGAAHVRSGRCWIREWKTVIKSRIVDGYRNVTAVVPPSVGYDERPVFLAVAGRRRMREEIGVGDQPLRTTVNG